MVSLGKSEHAYDSKISLSWSQLTSLRRWRAGCIPMEDIPAAQNCTHLESSGNVHPRNVAKLFPAWRRPWLNNGGNTSSGPPGYHPGPSGPASLKTCQRACFPGAAAPPPGEAKRGPPGPQGREGRSPVTWEHERAQAKRRAREQWRRPRVQTKKERERYMNGATWRGRENNRARAAPGGGRHGRLWGGIPGGDRERFAAGA